MRILVTGGAGYIGSVLVRRLLKQGHSVKILDNLMFGAESLQGIDNEPNLQFIRGDIRDQKTLRDTLNHIECLIHLAALVGHPLCYAQPQRTEQINYQATCHLLEQAVARGVKRFIFASTCSNYGISDGAGLAREDSQLLPLSIYAETKVKAEKYILSFPKKKGFSFCILRLATIFGLSPRMRFDLLINELVKDALIKKRIAIQNPDAWRPFLHIQDAAQAFIACLEAQSKQLSVEIFNVGCGNYQKREIAKLIKKYIPGTTVEILKNGKDNRDYRVSFEKIQEAIGFKNRLSLDQGIIEVRNAIEKGIILKPQSAKYTNLKFKNE